MKNLNILQGKRNITGIKAGLFILIFCCTFCSRTDNILLIRYTKILPPAPDTILADKASPASGDSNHLYSLSAAKLPDPDTHSIAMSPYHKINNIDIQYNSYSVPEQNTYAYLMGPNNEILDSVKITTSKKQVSSTYGSYYPARASFTMSKSVEVPVVKVVLPNDGHSPKGDEVFYIKFE